RFAQEAFEAARREHPLLARIPQVAAVAGRVEVSADVRKEHPAIANYDVPRIGLTTRFNGNRRALAMGGRSDRSHHRALSPRHASAPVSLKRGSPRLGRTRATSRWKERRRRSERTRDAGLAWSLHDL
ncbi:MAG TPA: hypothetical protein VM939_10445, partial [Gemmatimonadaceae bacterium]|nr:hypothetical protein [Gemmatimonadaceae bacterium]